MRSLKSWTNYWLYEPFIGGINYFIYYWLRFFSIDIASNIGGFLGKLSGKYLHPEKNDDITNNLIIIDPKITASDFPGFCNRSWENVGRVMAEMSVVNKIGDDRTTIHNDHYYLGTVKPGVPTIFLYPHLGNWELIALVAKKYGITLNIIYERLSNRFIRRIARNARKHHGHQLISSDFKGTRQIFTALKKGQSVGLAMDEFKYDQVQSPPFGRKKTKRTNIELAMKLSLQFNAPVIPVYCVRSNGTHFDIYADAPITTEILRKQGFEASVAQFEALCEKWLLEHLDQWYMLHRLKM